MKTCAPPRRERTWRPPAFPSRLEIGGVAKATYFSHSAEFWQEFRWMDKNLTPPRAGGKVADIQIQIHL